MPHDAAAAYAVIWASQQGATIAHRKDRGTASTGITDIVRKVWPLIEYAVDNPLDDILDKIEQSGKDKLEEYYMCIASGEFAKAFSVYGFNGWQTVDGVREPNETILQSNENAMIFTIDTSEERPDTDRLRAMYRLILATFDKVPSSFIGDWFVSAHYDMEDEGVNMLLYSSTEVRAIIATSTLSYEEYDAFCSEWMGDISATFGLLDYHWNDEVASD